MKSILYQAAKLLSSIYEALLKIIWKFDKKKFHTIKVYKDKKYKFSHYGDIALILYSLEHLVRFNRGFEFVTLSKYVEMIKPGDVVLDIGANIGLFSIIGSQLVGDNGKVFAFEPNSTTFKALKDNLGINKCHNVFPQFLALSDKEGFVSLSQPIEVTKNYLYSDAFSYMDFGKKVSETNSVSTIKLDEFLINNSISKVNLIKIDIEGAELLCFRGAQKLLSGKDAPVIIMECDEQYTERFDYCVSDVILFFGSLGYKMKQYEESQWIAIPPAKQAESFFN